MKPIALDVLCASMRTKGYNHASFLELDDLLRDVPPLRCNTKPENALYFSELEANETSVVPSWYAWIQCEEYELPCYGRKGIAFASFDFSSMVSQFHPGFAAGGAYLPSQLAGEPFIDWRAVQADGWAGVSVPNPRLGIWRNAGWDVPTVAVWSSSAMLEAVFFESTDADWVYDLDSMILLTDMIAKVSN